MELFFFQSQWLISPYRWLISPQPNLFSKNRTNFSPKPEPVFFLLEQSRFFPKTYFLLLLQFRISTHRLARHPNETTEFEREQQNWTKILFICFLILFPRISFPNGFSFQAFGCNLLNRLISFSDCMDFMISFPFPFPSRRVFANWWNAELRRQRCLVQLPLEVVEVPEGLNCFNTAGSACPQEAIDPSKNLRARSDKKASLPATENSSCWHIWPHCERQVQGLGKALQSGHYPCRKTYKIESLSYRMVISWEPDFVLSIIHESVLPHSALKVD